MTAKTAGQTASMHQLPVANLQCQDVLLWDCMITPLRLESQVQMDEDAFSLAHVV